MTIAALNWALSHPDSLWAWLRLHPHEHAALDELLHSAAHPIAGKLGDTAACFFHLHHERYQFYDPL